MIDVVRQQQQQDAATVPTVPAVRSVRLRNAESGVCTAVPLYVVHADEVGRHVVERRRGLQRLQPLLQDVPEELRLAFQDAVVLHVDANDASKASLSSLNGTLRLQHDEVDVMSPVVTVEGSVVTSAAGAEAGIESDLACSDLFDEFEARCVILTVSITVPRRRRDVVLRQERSASQAVVRRRMGESAEPRAPGGSRAH